MRPALHEGFAAQARIDSEVRHSFQKESFMKRFNRVSAATAAVCFVIAVFAGPAAAEDSKQLAQNKQVATAFYDAAINQKNYDAAVGYLGKDYKQHNPTAADGKAGLKSFIDFLKARFPNQKGEIKRVVAEGDLVVLHVHSTRGDGTPGRAIVDIFRVDDGKVVEHWDVIQDIPEKAANTNGMF
jgi:predicted SnoaL-like aldol condensation-catalyzing enzyme